VAAWQALGTPFPVSTLRTDLRKTEGKGLTPASRSVDPSRPAAVSSPASHEPGPLTSVRWRWADPGRRQSGEINTNDRGCGVYWQDPSGHLLEIITRPYGNGG
jgi:hypothetical protein